MPSKPKKIQRTHQGLCPELLDDEHKRLIRELAFLLMRTSNLEKPRLQFGAAGSPMAQCPSCLAHVWIADAQKQTIDSAVVVHDSDCVAKHCGRVIEADRLLSFWACREMVEPETVSGVAYARETEAMRVRARLRSETSSDSPATSKAKP